MNDLVIIENGKMVTTSLKVAEVFEKEHFHVLRDIKNLECDEEFIATNFGFNEYTGTTGRKLPMYNITRDGLVVLAMGYTGKKAMGFKIAYIRAFNLMEEKLRQPIYQNPLSIPVHEKMPQLADAVEASMKIAKIYGFEGNQAVLSANQAVHKIHGVDCLDLLGQKALVCEKQEAHLTATDIGRQIGLSAIKVNKRLEDAGIIYSWRDHKHRLKYSPTDKGRDFTVLKDTGKVSGGVPVQQLYYLESVIDFLPAGN